MMAKFFRVAADQPHPEEEEIVRDECDPAVSGAPPKHDYGRIKEGYHRRPPGTFSEGLDGLVPRLLKVYNAATKSGKKQSLKNILDCLVVRDDTNERRRAAALLGLPYYISGEDPSNVIRMCDSHAENLDEAMREMQLGILIGYEGE